MKKNHLPWKFAGVETSLDAADTSVCATSLANVRDATQTFAGTEVLLIGINGFVGKVVLGMLLDRFPGFRRLHILIRTRGEMGARERFEKQVLASPALAQIARRSSAALAEKVTLWAGDVAEPGCGLEPAAVETMRGRVGLIVNCAGLVEFTPPVDDSFRANVDGVEQVIELATRLDARLVHVSTCFVCGEADGLVEETDPIPGFYPRRRGPSDHSFRHEEEIRYMRERIREAYAAEPTATPRARSRQLAQKLADLGEQRAAHWGWVNTYTYSKSLGEQLIAAAPGLRYTIVRPAIVEAALEFPFPGWVEGGRTAAPLVIMAMSGLRHWPIRPEAPLEVVPVDQVAAAILAAGVLLLNDRHLPVYQLGTADANPVALGRLVRLMYAESRRVPGNRGVFRLPWPRGVRILSREKARRRRERIYRRFAGLQLLMVILRRLVQKAGLPGRRPLASLAVSLRVIGLQLQLREQTLDLYQPFVYDNRFLFEAENIRASRALLSVEDRRLLPWTPERIDWNRYWIEQEVRGILRWVQPEAAAGTIRS